VFCEAEGNLQTIREKMSSCRTPKLTISNTRYIMKNKKPPVLAPWAGKEYVTSS